MLTLHRSQSQAAYNVTLGQQRQNCGWQHGEHNPHAHKPELNAAGVFGPGNDHRHWNGRFSSEGQGEQEFVPTQGQTQNPGGYQTGRNQRQGNFVKC